MYLCLTVVMCLGYHVDLKQLNTPPHILRRGNLRAIRRRSLSQSLDLSPEKLIDFNGVRLDLIVILVVENVCIIHVEYVNRSRVEN